MKKGFLITLAIFVLAFAEIACPREALAQEQFLGEIRMVGFNFAPTGWAKCDGQILSIASNTALFSLLGTTYGGDGVSTFALPNLKGRVPLHYGTGSGLTPRAIGEQSGLEAVTLTQAEMPAHNHSLMGTDKVATSRESANNVLARSWPGPAYRPESASTASHSTSISSTGGGLPHENMPPFLTVNFIIALEGIFPSRP